MNDVVVVGRAGHVGFPLALAFASKGLSTCVYDIDIASLERITQGLPPFREPGAAAMLEEALTSGTFLCSSDAGRISKAETVVVVVGTPLDEHLAPDADAVPRVVKSLLPYLRSGQLLVLRNTVYPGVTRRVEAIVGAGSEGVELAFCPERIAEGRALTELFVLPQIVSGCSPIATQRAASLFGKLTPSIFELSPEEAELAELFTNAWRYVKFAAANQLFMIANDLDVDYERVRHAMTYDYPGAADVPGAGFAAGPCFFKDTRQLAAVTGNKFALGHSAMLVNEGLPGYLVSQLECSHDLSSMNDGILGMAFKADSDDVRASLSYKLKKVLAFRAKEVLATDPFVTTDADLLALDDVVARSDLLILTAPHKEYRDLTSTRPIADSWNLLERGVRI